MNITQSINSTAERFKRKAFCEIEEALHYCLVSHLGSFPSPSDMNRYCTSGEVMHGCDRYSYFKYKGVKLFDVFMNEKDGGIKIVFHVGV